MDYKLLIALAALALSLYNFVSSRRSRGLEKRTEILADIAEVELVMSKLNRVFKELDLIDFRESPTMKESFRRCEIATKEIENQATEIFDAVSKKYPPDANVLEKILPDVRRLVAKAKNCLVEATSVKKEIESIVSERPKIVDR